MANYFQSFVGKFAPSSNLIKPAEKTIKKYKNILPKDLIDFWMEYGFGNYGNGLVKIIDPSTYENVVGINKECDVPLLVGSFGDIFIYRTIPAKNLKAIGILNVHFRNREFFIVDENCIEEFFEGIDTSLPILRKNLFVEGTKKCGDLTFDEIFFFTPALATGGGEDIKYVEKGTAFVHYELLVQMLGANFDAKH